MQPPQTSIMLKTIHIGMTGGKRTYSASGRDKPLTTRPRWTAAMTLGPITAAAMHATAQEVGHRSGEGTNHPARADGPRTSLACERPNAHEESVQEGA